MYHKCPMCGSFLCLLSLLRDEHQAYWVCHGIVWTLREGGLTCETPQEPQPQKAGRLSR
jgi:hypothetical protein